MIESVNERRLLAMLVGDVVGYSRLMAADTERAIASIGRLRDLIGDVVVARNGRLVDFVGDNFLAEFGSAVHALQSAIEIQSRIHGHNVTADNSAEQYMRVRIGAHVGDVRLESGRIYGDALNIAARLEPLSEPGGICLSGQILDQVSGHIRIDLEDFGLRELKNISRPIHAYRVLADTIAASPARPEARTAAKLDERFGFLGIPTIAVLPFANLSTGAEQDHIVEAVTVDVITALSCDKRLAVIAYSSVRQFKGVPTDVKEIGARLEARYLVEGSVRHMGPRIRISVALIDVETRRELWGNKIDSPAAALFEVFDELVETIVLALASNLNLAESERFRRKQPEQLDAWALATYGLASRGWLSLDKSLNLAQQALAIDPNYAYAWAVSGFLTAFKFPMGLSVDHGSDITVSLNHTDRALTLDTVDPWNLVAKGVALQYAGRPAESMEYLERSLRLNPSDVLAHCYYGRGLMFSGRPALAIPHFERFQRLNPTDPNAHLAGMYHAIARMFLCDWAGTVQTARESLAACGGRNPWTWVVLMIGLAGLGNLDEARAALPELKSVAPHWDRQFVEDFFTQCQEDRALLRPMFEILRTVWA